MDRFIFVESEEPLICGWCPKCKEEICEGDEIFVLQVDGTMVHEDCIMEYVMDEFDIKKTIAEQGEWNKMVKLIFYH